MLALEEELPEIRSCDLAIDIRASLAIGSYGSILLTGGVETSMVALGAHDDCEAWLLALRVGLCAGFAEERQFLCEDLVELAFGDAVAVEDYAVGECLVVVLFPEVEARD